MNHCSRRNTGYSTSLAIATTALAIGCAHPSQKADSTEPATARLTADEAESSNFAGGTVARTVSQSTAALPDQAQWASLYDFTKTLDLTAPDISFKMSDGGTSVYAVLVKGDRPIGAVIPQNSATMLSGEIGSFNLARIIGMADMYQPAVHYVMQGKSLEAFRTLVDGHPETNKDRAANREEILKKITEGTQKGRGLDAIFKPWDLKPEGYDALVTVSANSLNATHIIPGSTAPIASLIQCQGPKPGRSVKNTITIKDKKGKKKSGTATELDLARQLSSMLLVDAVMHQWDRFSGGNLSVVFEANGAAKFYSADNGGTWGATEKTTDMILPLVTRFDREIAKRILDLDAFLNNGQRPYMGLWNDADFLSAMGFANIASPKTLAKIKLGVAKTAAHIRGHESCYFE